MIWTKSEKSLKIFTVFLVIYMFLFGLSMAAEWSTPTKLISLSGDEMFPTISPDGSRLAFVEYQNDNGKTVFNGVWLMSLQTGEQKAILLPAELLGICSVSGVTEFSSMEVWRLSWNPNGKEILFSAYCRIPNGDKVVRFGLINTVTAEVEDFKSGEHPSWSPDGNEIIYLYKHGPTVAACQRCGKELWVMNRDGSNAHMIYNVYGNPALSAVPDCTIIVNDTILWPSFSPDGKKVLFEVSHNPENSSIDLANADGSGFKQLISGSDFSNPQFTADGKEIIFLESKNNQTTIWSMSSDGTDLEQLSSSDALKMNGLSVSPDGKKVFFPMVGDGSGFDIWAIEKEEPSEPVQSKVVLYLIIITSILLVCILFLRQYYQSRR